MRTPLLVLCLGLAQAAASFESVSLNGTWGFSREGGAESPVEVPHDWAIAGPFDPAAGRVRFAVDGGELLAVGNGNPFSFESFCADNCLLFNGRAVAVVRRSGTNIPVRIVARVEGLEKGCLEL